MSALVLTTAMTQVSTTWTGTAPGTSAVPSGTPTTPTDISAYLFSVEMPWNIAAVDGNNFGAAGFAVFLAGLKSSDVKLGINQDYAASAIDSLVRGWFTSATSPFIYLDIKPTNAARSATNPSYVCQALVNQYTPVIGTVGAKAMMTLQWPVTGYYTFLTS